MPGGSGNLQSPTDQGFPSSAPPAANSSFETPRRAPTISGRPTEELHISASASQHTSGPSSTAAQQQMYNPPDGYRSAPNINIDQATPQNSQYGTATVPGSLQPAGGAAQQQRPGPVGQSYTSPVVPTQTNAQQYTLPTRSNTLNQSQNSPHSTHSYSRSSPAGMAPDQKYVPFSNNTPEQPKYAAGTPAQKYYPSTPSGAASQSPLGLADIRPRANSNMNEEGAGHNANVVSDHGKVPSNSNYIAPWPIYAYDWCKWNVPGGTSAGKMAVGSYLEDSHNFVSSICRWSFC